MAYNNRAAVWNAKGDYNRAIADLDEATRLDSKSAQYYTNRSGIWNAKGNYDRAIADASDAIKLDPKSAKAYNNRSNAWRNKRENDRAIADASEAIKLDPKFAGPYINRAAARYAKGDYDRAIADGTEAIRLDPKAVQAYNNRSAAWLAKRDYDRAISDADAAIKLDPKFAQAYTNRSAAWASKGAYDRAIADASEAIRLDPKPEPYINRGKMYEIKGDYDRAVADYNEAIRLDPKIAQAYTARSKLYEMLDRLAFTSLQIGELDRALAGYDALLKLNPKLATSLYGRGITKMKKGDTTGGNGDITAAKAIQPNVAAEFAKFGVIPQQGETAAREAPQSAWLNEEDPATKKYTPYVGSVVWHLESFKQKPGPNPEARVDAAVEIPNHFSATISFARNTDKTLPASYIIEITFTLPADFAHGGIANIPGVMAAAPPARGEPLFGQSVQVAPRKFSVALGEMYVQRNLQLLREQPRIHVPIVFTDGRRAILAIDKGTPGQLALGAWATQKP